MSRLKKFVSRLKKFLEHSDSEYDNNMNNTLKKIASYAGFLAIGIVVGYILFNIFN